MIEEFKKHRYTLYQGRWPGGRPLGPIQPDGSVVDAKGLQRFQIIDNGLYAANSELVGPIHKLGEELVVTDDRDCCLYSIRRDMGQGG